MCLYVYIYMHAYMHAHKNTTVGDLSIVTKGD